MTLVCHLYIWATALVFLPGVISQLVRTTQKTAVIPGDIYLGVLFPVHHQPKQNKASRLECGEIREQYGIQRVEAAKYAVHEINENPNILPGIKLGIEIRDTCWYSATALEQSIEFIRDAITGPDPRNINRSTCSHCPQDQPPANKNLVGVVGPGPSDISILIQNLLQLFNIPQIGYAATTQDLSDTSRFPYFLRVVPSDYFQAQVMVHLIQHYNWTYVSAVHTDGNYGQSGMTAFRELAEANNICIAKEDSVLSNAEDSAFDEVIRVLSEDKRANVVVCFCEGMTVRNLLKATQRRNQTSRFLFVGSDGWADRSDVIAGIEDAAVGGISVKIQTPYVHKFDEVYFKLKPHNNKQNPWFKEFWEHRFNCTLNNSTNQNNVPGKHKVPLCTGNESLADGYKQDTKMSFVIKAIYTMAYGLHNLHKDVCKGQPGICKEMLPVNGRLYMDYLINVTFPYMNDIVSFDSKGDPSGRYDIMNFQKLSNGSYEYIKVGSWDKGTLIIDESSVRFKESNIEPPTSLCSMPCMFGQVKTIVTTGDGGNSCCWVCGDCDINEYLGNETTCVACAQDEWPNKNKTGCDPIVSRYQDFSDNSAIFALSLAGLGFMATLTILIVFVKHNHTPIVRSSTKELSYLILVGMLVSYLASIPLLHPPTTWSCALSRTLPGLSFTMMYGSLLTKTNRIARLLGTYVGRRRFMTARAQIIMTCTLIAFELIIVLGMVIYEPPEAVKSYPALGEVRLVCNTTPEGVLIPLVFNFFLIFLCTVYAILTRNLPQNFNEAKFIGFSMYSTCVIWLAWAAIYFTSPGTIICMSISTSLSALVILILLFCQKTYYILLRPDLNKPTWCQTLSFADMGHNCGSSTHNHSERRSSGPAESGSRPNSFHGQTAGSNFRKLIALQMEVNAVDRSKGVKSMRREAHPKAILKRGTSLFGDLVFNIDKSYSPHRPIPKSFGSQLDFSTSGPARDGGAIWGQESKACQTSDDLLDSLIARFRRRVIRAVKEGTIDREVGREFFNEAELWLHVQAEAVLKSYRAESNGGIIDNSRHPLQTSISNPESTELSKRHDNHPKIEGSTQPSIPKNINLDEMSTSETNNLSNNFLPQVKSLSSMENNEITDKSSIKSESSCEATPSKIIPLLHKYRDDNNVGQSGKSATRNDKPPGPQTVGTSSEETCYNFTDLDSHTKNSWNSNEEESSSLKSLTNTSPHKPKKSSLNGSSESLQRFEQFFRQRGLKFDSASETNVS